LENLTLGQFLVAMWVPWVSNGSIEGENTFPLNASLRSLLPLKGKADGLAREESN